MANIVPFPTNGSLPSYLKRRRGLADAFRANVVAGFPVLSIKGKTFTLVRDGQRTLISKKDEDGEEVPATSVEIVLLNANPQFSKVFYANGYEEGSQEKPTCFSNNGVAPDAASTEPQAKTCAACPHNVWGSGNEGRGKACSDTRRVAIATVGRLDDPILLRIPPASLKPMAEYAMELDRHGLDPHMVVTRLKFDPEAATPKLAFSPRGLLDEASLAESEQSAESELVRQICGLSDDAEPAPVTTAKADIQETEVAAAMSADEDEEPAPEPKKPAAKKPAAKKAPAKKAAPKKAAPAPAEDDDDDEEEVDDLDAALDDVLASFDD